MAVELDTVACRITDLTANPLDIAVGPAARTRAAAVLLAVLDLLGELASLRAQRSAAWHGQRWSNCS
jgi:hypothetical protein